VVLALAWPVLLQQFLVLSVGLSDRFLAGRLQPLPGGQQAEVLQVAYQSAQTTAHYLGWFINSYAILVSVGSIALVARFVGAGDRRLAVHATNQSILLAVVLGLAGTVFGLVLVDPLMHGLGLHGHAALFAADYLRPLLWLLVFQIVQAAGIACLIGAGDTRTGMWVTAGVAVINVPLAWGFFHGWGPLPKLGFVGIAVGTAVSYVLAALVVLTVLARGRAGLRLSVRDLRPDWGLLRRLLRVSVPAAVDSLSVAACQLWFLSIINRLGDTASSAHGIALGWEALAYLSGHAFGIAAMSLIGRELGAGRPDRAARSGWTAFALGTGVMCVMGAVFYLFAPEMFGLFCPHPEQRPVVEAGVPVLRLIAYATPVMACTMVFPQALRGAGDTRVPVLFTWVGFLVVRIPLAYLLTARYGLYGAWLAMAADLAVRGGLLLLRFAGGRWQAARV
jgi:putative MATE family efflux protein